MHKAKWIALAWAGANVALSYQSSLNPTTPLLARTALCFLPAVLFVLCAELVAKFLPFGYYMEAFASDAGEEQSPAAVMFFGFVLIATTTLLLLFV
jgi:hypothetical protein